MGIENVRVTMQMSWFFPRAHTISDSEYGETSQRPFCYIFSGLSEKNLRDNLWCHIIWQNHRGNTPAPTSRPRTCF
jgi:hypothetical protein